MEDDDQNGGARKRIRRMKYALLEDDWGEDDMNKEEDKDSVVPEIVPPPPTRPSLPGTKMTTITDFFSRIPKTTVRIQDKKRKRMDNDMGDLWTETDEDNLWMEEHTNQLADLINPGGMRMKDVKDFYVTEVWALVLCICL